MWRLVYPLRYFRLVNSEKHRLDLIPTLILGLLLASVFVFLPGASFFKPDGFLDKLLNLTSALTGFYVAALVAAATFDHPDLDKVIKSGPIALITTNEDGKRVQELLTRREFTCTVFGYLAFATLLISLACALGVGASRIEWQKLAAWPYVGVLFTGNPFFWFRALIVAMYCAAVAHVVVATSLGLWYLMDRLYRNDRKITTTKAEIRDRGAA